MSMIFSNQPFFNLILKRMNEENMKYNTSLYSKILIANNLH